MSSSFDYLPNAVTQAILARRKRLPYDVKDDEEIPLEGMQQVQTQATAPQELPIATAYAKDAEQRPATQLEIPLHQVATVQPLSKEQEIDLRPTAENDKTREGYQSLYNAGTPKPEMPDHSKEHHGFLGDVWQHLRHAGKGALVGAYLGGRAGGAGVLGGALAGGLTGAISPKAADTMEYNTITEPRWEQDNKIAQEEAARKADIANHYAQTYGTALFDPNQKTQQAKTQEEAAKDRQERQTALETDRATKNTIARDRETRLAASQKLSNLRRLWEKGGITDPKDKAAFAQLSGVSGALADAYINGEATEDVDGQGRMVIVHKRTGKRELVTDPDTGQPVMSFKVTQQQDRQRHEKEMESQGRQHIGIAQQNTDISRARMQSGNGVDRREALKGIDQHNRYKKEANDLYAQADKFRQQAEVAKNDSERDKLLARATEAQRRADDRKRSANDRAQELAADYPDHVEVGEKDGFYYAKPKAGARTAGAASRSTAPSTPPARTITKADYDARVKQHGQAAVDEQLKKLGITVQ